MELDWVEQKLQERLLISCFLKKSYAKIIYLTSFFFVIDIKGLQIFKNCSVEKICQRMKLRAKIDNIKLRFFLNKSLCKLEKTTKKRKFKINHIHFCIYLHTPNMINATNFTNLLEIEKYKNKLEALFNVKVYNIIADNFFLSLNQKKNLDMEKLYNQLRNDKSIFVWFNQEQRAQEIIIHQKKTGKPTCIVYRTGSLVLMGKSSTELSNKNDKDNYLELINNQIVNLRRYEKYLLNIIQLCEK